MNGEEVKRGGLSRADVAEAREQAGEAAAAFVAGQLGLEPAAPRVVHELDFTDGIEGSATVTELLRSSAPAPHEIPPSDRPQPNQARVRFWRLDRRDTVKTSPPPKPSKLKPLSEPFWDEPPSQSAPYHLLADPAAWMQRLLHVLNDERTTRCPDVPRVVETLGRGEVVREIPYAHRRALGRHVHVIDDRHLHLTPYWIDHEVFAGELFRRLPGYAHSRSVLVAGQSEPQAPLSLQGGRSDREWTLPPADSVVVAFTDLGALSRQPEAQRRAWRGITRRLLARGCRLIAITPALWRDTDPQLAAQWELLPWDAAPQRNRSQAMDRQTAAERVLELLAPAIRIEPGLTRAARLLLARRGEAMDAGVEAVVWQHPSLASRHSVAATMTGDSRRRGLKTFNAIDPELRREFLEEIRAWRRVETLVSKQVWFEELMALDAAGLNFADLGKSLSDDFAKARNYFLILNDHLRTEDGEAALDRETCQWFQRLESRWRGLNTDAGRESDVVVHQISRVLPRKPGDPPPLVHNPEQQPPPKGESATLALYQTGQRIVARPHIEAEIAPHGLSPLGLIEATRNQSISRVRLYWEARSEPDGGVGTPDNAEIDPDSEAPQTVLRIPPGATRVLVRSDRETLQWRHDERPDWADAYGRDRYGLWADWSYRGVSQRFRWIPPGSFWMGSPPNEKGRANWEDQHHVTLTRGFWLAETSVTQALWRLVMGNNPSRFKGDNRPVENVSWDDSQQMVQKLNANQAHGRSMFMLPTEAQWEYACRAGTHGPFSFGGELKLEKVNFLEEAYSFMDSASLAHTADVASYSPNAWGLYEMHGNVWEWCQDLWTRNLGTRSLENPLHNSEVAMAHRVTRGGSWASTDTQARAAYREPSAPDDTGDGVGFRLARGHIEPGAGGAGQ